METWWWSKIATPEGGNRTPPPDGSRYIYATFWTRITNHTADSLQLTMEFPTEPTQLPSAPDRNFTLLIPADTLTSEKEAAINYGLNLDAYLAEHLYTRTPFKRTIHPNDSSGFYIVTLFNQGVDGVLRAGLTFKQGKIHYRLNELEMDCGEINLKELRPRE